MRWAPRCAGLGILLLLALAGAGANRLTNVLDINTSDGAERVYIHTDFGVIPVKLLPENAPTVVAAIKEMVDRPGSCANCHFYRNEARPKARGIAWCVGGDAALLTRLALLNASCGMPARSRPWVMGDSCREAAPSRQPPGMPCTMTWHVGRGMQASEGLGPPYGLLQGSLDLKEPYPPVEGKLTTKYVCVWGVACVGWGRILERRGSCVGSAAWCWMLCCLAAVSDMGLGTGVPRATAVL